MDISYLLALHSIDGLGPIRLKRLIDYFQDPKQAWIAPKLTLRSCAIPENVVEQILLKRRELDPEKYAEEILKKGVSVVSLYDDSYPKLLKQIYDPPVILFYKGDLDILNTKSIAIVGTRKVTGYGRIITHQFAFELAKKGLLVVSGLARGVDSVAHMAAIEAGGKTAGVLGGGLLNISPSENIDLAEKIENGFGAVLSEYPPQAAVLPGNFPARNRIIAGLSHAVLVTEAAIDSGSLITARFALEQGKSVYAVPGPITSALSQGTGYLIKEGAGLVMSVGDILDEMDIKPNASFRETMSNLTKIEEAILNLLSREAKHIDEICRELKLSSSDVSANLIKMEIAGLVKTLGAGNYIKSY